MAATVRFFRFSLLKTMSSVQQCLEEYRQELAARNYDLRREHWNWHTRNRRPEQLSPSYVPTWGADLHYGTMFLEMHRMMLFAGPNDRMMDMPEGIFPWFHRKGYSIPQTWDGRTPPAPALGYTPPAPQATEPDGRVRS